MMLSDSPTWIALPQGIIEARSRSQVPQLRTGLITRDVAAALLTAELQRSVAAGARVEYAIDTTAVLTYGRRPNHVLHLLLALLTFGLWIIVWALLTFAFMQMCLHLHTSSALQ